MLKNSHDKALKITYISLSQTAYYHYFPTITSQLLAVTYIKYFSLCIHSYM